MSRIELRLDWIKFQSRIDAFEALKLMEYRSKYANLDELEIQKKVIRSTDRKFKGQSKELLNRQMRL